MNPPNALRALALTAALAAGCADDSVRYPTSLDAGWQPYFSTRPPTEKQREGHVNLLESLYRADYSYYAGSGPITYNNRATDALNLPRAVLEKFYHANAERLFRLDK